MGNARFADLSRRLGITEPQEDVAGDLLLHGPSSGGGRRNVLGSLAAAGLAMVAGLGLSEQSAAGKGNNNGNENGQTKRRSKPKPGPKGDRGDAGPQGDPGAKGDKGDTGPQGAAGASGVAPSGTIICNKSGGGNQCSGYDDCPAPYNLCVREGGAGGFTTNGICCRLS